MTPAAQIKQLLAKSQSALTVCEIAERLDLIPNTVAAALVRLRDCGAAIDVGRRAVSRMGQPRKLWSLTGQLGDGGSPGPEESRCRVVKPESQERESDEGSSTSWVETIRGTEGFACGRLQSFVAFADCLDGYVDATAMLKRTPCNGCPIGAEHRRTYAEEAPGDKKSRIDWDVQPLGQMPDRDLAQRIGCSHGAVEYQRAKRQIRAFGLSDLAWAVAQREVTK